MEHDDLMKRYQDRIKRIKILKYKTFRAFLILNDFESSTGNHDYTEFLKLSKMWGDARNSFRIEYEKLSQDIGADTSFEGIKKFWELAEI